MSQYAWPVLYTLLVWWVSTGVILYLDGLPRRTFRWSLLGATILLAGALYGLAGSKADTSVGGAYLAFTCGVLAWAWQEVGFLLGLVTGPRQIASPPGCSAGRHLLYAVQAILYHELALFVIGAAVIAATWGGANQVGTWTFLILWVMRQSAKLNLFLGVRNLNESFLPEHLRYMQSYFRRRPMNLLFPVSVCASTFLAVLLWADALAASSSPFEATGLAFCATLLSLAILEHWFLVLPLPSEKLWNWGLRSRKPFDFAPADPARPHSPG
jgi:putative photosynthetic complex assembly protein 2